jgi:hypothetical protein
VKERLELARDLLRANPAPRLGERGTSIAPRLRADPLRVAVEAWGGALVSDRSAGQNRERCNDVH